jgi:hypothetical protein
VGEPDPPSGTSCWLSGGKWYCDEDKDVVKKAKLGCATGAADQWGFAGLSTVFTTSKITDSTECGEGHTTPCYVYSTVSDFAEKIKQCTQTAQAGEQCRKETNCFQSVCSDSCPSACALLVRGDCLLYSVNQCKIYETQFRAWQNGLTGESFKELPLPHEPFRYEFAARPNEVIFIDVTMNFNEKVAQWSAASQNVDTTKDNPITAKFLSMIKIYRKSDNKLVHQSFTFERAFFGSFTLRMGTLFENAEAGEVYQVQVHYFLPKFDETFSSLNLNVDLKSISYIVYRNQK